MMYGSEGMVSAVRDWCREHLPELTNGYNYEPTEKTTLPDVVVVLDTSTIEFGDTSFPLHALQQNVIQRYDCTISFMVDNGEPEPAAIQLRRFADTLRAQLLKDGTLGQRVPVASPFVTFDYTPPFVVYPDGTRGREMTMTISVAELAEVEQ
jgi:hypothetical protein